MRRLRLRDPRYRLGWFRNAAKILLRPRNGFVRREIANDHQRCIIGTIECVKEFLNVGQRGLIEIFHASNRGVIVGVHLKSRRVEIFDHVAVRHIVEAVAALFFHHFALGFEIVTFQIVAGEGLPKHGHVRVGGSVVESAHGFDDAGMLLGWDVRRALEHEMFKKVREARSSRPLVLRAYVIPDL